MGKSTWGYEGPVGTNMELTDVNTKQFPETEICVCVEGRVCMFNTLFRAQLLLYVPLALTKQELCIFLQHIFMCFV
jgi:hypothetical protein